MFRNVPKNIFHNVWKCAEKTISKVIWAGKGALDAILSQDKKKIGDRFHFQWHRRRLNYQFSNYVTDKINGSRVQPSLLGEGQRPDPGDGGNRAYRWRGCSRTVRLGIPQQFRQRPVSFDTRHTTAHSGTTGWHNSLSTVVASATLVSNTAKIVDRPPLRLRNWKHVFLPSVHTPELLHNHSLKLFDTRISDRKNWPPWADTNALLHNCLCTGPRPHCRFITGR